MNPIKKFLEPSLLSDLEIRFELWNGRNRWGMKERTLILNMWWLWLEWIGMEFMLSNFSRFRLLSSLIVTLFGPNNESGVLGMHGFWFLKSIGYWWVVLVRSVKLRITTTFYVSFYYVSNLIVILFNHFSIFLWDLM